MYIRKLTKHSSELLSSAWDYAAEELMHGGESDEWITIIYFIMSKMIF